MKKKEYTLSLKKTWNTTHKVWDYEVERIDKSGSSWQVFEDLETALAMLYLESEEHQVFGLGNIVRLQSEDQSYLGKLTREHFTSIANLARYLLDSFYEKPTEKASK